MKASLKGINFKEVLVNHAEKIVLGCAVLASLFIMSGTITNWKGYDKEPADFDKALKKSQTQLKVTEWPKEEQTKYSKFDEILPQAEKLILPAGADHNIAKDDLLSKFEFTTKMNPGIHPGIKKIKAPQIFALESPVADPGWVLMPIIDSSLVTAVSDGATDEVATPKGDETDEYGRRNKGRRNGPGELGAPVDPGEIDAPADGAEGGAGIATTNARGFRFVAVRMVFPYRKQLREVANALDKSVDEIIDDVNFYDFELERQEAVPGPNPWAGKWEKVDIEIAKEILNQAADFDQEVVDINNTDAVFTMSLVYRIMGRWGALATHPRIQQLNKEELKLQEATNKKVIDWQKKQEQAMGGTREELKQKRKGLTSVQRDVRNSGRKLMEGADGAEFLTEIRNDFDSGGNGRQVMEGVKAKLKKTSQLLLFRYFDFDVKPGHAYRYRARLWLINPNYGRALETVERPDIVEEKLITSKEWSKITQPAVVPTEVNYFVQKVDTRYKGTKPPSVKFDIFHRKPETGTTINSSIEIAQGEKLSQMVKTRVLRPAPETFDEEEIEIGPEASMLVDVNNDGYVHPTMRDKLFADLNIGKKIHNVGAVDQVLIVDKSGALIMQNPLDDAIGDAKFGLRFNKQNRPWEDLKKKKEEKEGTDFGDFATAGSEEMADPAAGG